MSLNLKRVYLFHAFSFVHKSHPRTFYRILGNNFLLFQWHTFLYGRTFHKLCVINIISALHKENKLQLRCKNSKLFRLIPRKKDSQYQVPVLNLPTENINTTPLRYGLHHSFIDKNKCVKRNAPVELETLARVLDAHVTHTEKEPFHEYLSSATNIITKNVYSDVDNTYKSLSNLINNKNIVILGADKEICTVILNRKD